ncbi:GNAT family N-acetyltransferase [Streptomyces sp. NPDC002580]|uniref:GNAT family N-acetyltransferase n=1 Tax=Streptomyces sp. NPDC002580 TaxID=3364653 RepID=UPI0036C3C92D
MRPTDASTDAGPAHTARPESGSAPGPGSGPGPVSGAATGLDPGPDTDSEDTLDLRLPDELIALFAGDRAGTADTADAGARAGAGEGGDLLDRVGGWGPTKTSAGVFHLVPVRAERDLSLITRWMNDPAVAAFWELAGAESVVEEHLRRQLDGDGRSVPCLGALDGTPMSYWELYRADLDRLARHYPARPHDTGVHLLIGGVADRARGLGSTLLRAVADHVFDMRPACARVVAEPDLRNTPSVSAFLSAGFRFSAEVELPGKRAALMIRDRALRDLA